MFCIYYFFDTIWLYRLVVSDGIHYMQGMLAPTQNPLVEQQAIQPNCIIELEEYVCNAIQARKVMIILKCNVIGAGGPTVSVIGNAVNIEQLQNGSADHSMSGNGMNQQMVQPTMNNGNFKQEPMNNNNNYMKPAMNNPYHNAAPSVPSTSSYNQSQQFHPIASLNPYHPRWTIKARVTNKTPMKSWSNASGDGKLFSVDLLDSAGGQIRATMFKEAAAKFFDLLQENQVYIISKGQLKLANKKFSKLPCDYELTLNHDAEITLVEEEGMCITRKLCLKKIYVVTTACKRHEY